MSPFYQNVFKYEGYIFVHSSNCRVMRALLISTIYSSRQTSPTNECSRPGETNLPPISHEISAVRLHRFNIRLCIPLSLPKSCTVIFSACFIDYFFTYFFVSFTIWRTVPNLVFICLLLTVSSKPEYCLASHY